MEKVEFKSNGLCGVLKASKTHLRHWKTAGSKRLDFIKSTTTDAKVTFGRKFYSAKLEVFDQNTLLTVYSIQFFETGSITIQGTHVSQWYTFECVGLKQLVDKLEKSDSTLHEGIIRHNLLEPTWDNNWFQPASINQSFTSTSPDGTNVHKSIDHDQPLRSRPITNSRNRTDYYYLDSNSNFS